MHPVHQRDRVAHPGGFRARPEWTAPFVGSAALLVIAVVLGGASRQHELRLAVVELASLPLLIVSVFTLLKSSPDAGPSRLFLGLLAGLVAIPLLQLVPLPPAVWTRLPGREEMVLALELGGLTPGWSPLSLTPDKTWRSLLALLPPVAMALGVLATPSAARRHLATLLLWLVVAAIVLGTIQLASGGERFYPWQTTNAGALVGFFANRHHMATLCLATLPLAVGLAARALRKSGNDVAAIWLTAALTVLLIIAIGAIRSRMGVVLLVPVLGASLVSVWIATGRSRPSPILLLLAAASVIALVILANFTLPSILARFGGGSGEVRLENWTYVIAAADRYAPVGSGIGSFDAVFRSVEPLARLDNTYFNQAHNDYLETWLETGWAGLILFGVFAVWFARRAWRAWRASGTGNVDLQRGATVAILAVLLHSTVDYPLRTAAMAMVFALLCAVLEPTPDADRRNARGRPRSSESY